jgi:hypothetical protein
MGWKIPHTLPTPDDHPLPQKAVELHVSVKETVNTAQKEGMRTMEILGLQEMAGP